MNNEFIELANTTLAQVSGLIFNQMQNSDISDEKRIELDVLEKIVLYDKRCLYFGTDEERKRIFEKVKLFYAPFLKNSRTV